MATVPQTRSSRIWVLRSEWPARGQPLDPPPSRWLLSPRDTAEAEDLSAVGADLAPGTVLSAYRTGLFPMGIGPDGAPPIGWWSPRSRGVLGPGDLHISRSLMRSSGRFEVRIDTAFDKVIGACADPRRPGRWITEEIRAAYGRLHEMGWVHSVEVWTDGNLAGGLYGVSIGGLFAGESMFHHRNDASKAALVGLVQYLEDTEGSSRSEDSASWPWLIDVQWQTPHLASLGVREVSRSAYLQMLPILTEQGHRWPGAAANRDPTVRRRPRRGNI